MLFCLGAFCQICRAPLQHVTLMRLLPALLLWVGIHSMLLAQESYYPVIAEQGDGIFSILRKQGLDPVKYYEAFITLNEAGLKDGSQLHVGREYKIPMVEDSYKNKGIRLLVNEASEEPIFNAELGEMSHKVKTLKDAVYYLIAEDSINPKNNFVDDITKNLAAELLKQGATVYVLGSVEPNAITVDSSLTKVNQMGSYVEAVNKRYLQNQGKYQRLLIIRANGMLSAGNLEVSVYHHDKSEQGQRLAENLQKVFKRNSISNRSSKKIETFGDKNTLFLAKNTLPAVSLISITNRSQLAEEKGIPVRTDKRAFANWITNGILKDYADIQIEN